MRYTTYDQNLTFEWPMVALRADVLILNKQDVHFVNVIIYGLLDRATTCVKINVRVYNVRSSKQFYLAQYTAKMHVKNIRIEP